MACVAFCFSDDWIPNVWFSLEFGINLLKELGVIKSYRTVRFFALWLLKTRPKTPCMRIQFMGVDDENRGRGIGTKMARLLKEEFKKEGYHYIQGEIEEVNAPSKRVTFKEGAKAQKHFRIDGVDWIVVLMPLD
ncbi:MAG: GNAT family N-acetyltransferase [Halobacteriota archaeon]|nr:GNAT family N-acetyltransferase [Halobacteriota archaeon]